MLTFPVFLTFLLLGRITSIDGAFQGFSQMLSLIPGKIGVYFRAAFYRLACTDTSDDISVGFLTVLSHQDTTIQQGVYIGPQCNIGKCFIGENTLIGSGVHILSGSQQHNFVSTLIPIKDQEGIFLKVSIGSDCWLGNQSLVMTNLAGKTIVAAGSVVTTSSRSGDILAGNPAKPLKNRFDSSESASAQSVETGSN